MSSGWCMQTLADLHLLLFTKLFLQVLWYCIPDHSFHKIMVRKTNSKEFWSLRPKFWPDQNFCDSDICGPLSWDCVPPSLDSNTGHYISTVAVVLELLAMVQQWRGLKCNLTVLNCLSIHYYTYWKYIYRMPIMDTTIFGHAAVVLTYKWWEIQLQITIECLFSYCIIMS